METTKDVYVYHLESTQEEIEFKNSVLTKENIYDIKSTTNDILKLDIVKQLQIIHCIVDIEYNSFYNEYNKFIEKLLSQKCFADHINILLFINDNDTIKKIAKFEKKYNINIVDSYK